MPQQLIGLSFSSCVKLVAEYNIPLDRVRKVICGGRGKRQADWELRIQRESQFVDSGIRNRFTEVAQALRDQGKLRFPDEIASGMSCWQPGAAWTTDNHSVIPMLLYRIASDEINDLLSDAHFSTIVPEAGSVSYNTILGFNPKEIRQIKRAYSLRVANQVLTGFLKR